MTLNTAQLSGLISGFVHEVYVIKGLRVAYRWLFSEGSGVHMRNFYNYSRRYDRFPLHFAGIICEEVRNGA